MNLTIDQFDTVHMCLRRASAVSWLIAGCSERREQIEIPANVICAATYLVVELVGRTQEVLREARDGVAVNGGSKEDTHHTDGGEG